MNRRSPTVEHSYALDPTWFDRYATPFDAGDGNFQPGWQDPEGFCADGWDMDSSHYQDRAGYTQTEYDEDSRWHKKCLGHTRNSLYERILSEWSHRRLGDLYTRTLPPASPASADTLRDSCEA